MSELGYVVLTSTDGGWQPDWDGQLHVTSVAAWDELEQAANTLGDERVKLGRVVEVER